MTARRWALVVTTLVVLATTACGSGDDSDDGNRPGISYSCGELIDQVQKQAYADTGKPATAAELKLAYDSPACS